MEAKAAEALLARIEAEKQAKTAEFSGLAGWLPETPPEGPLYRQVMQNANQQMKSEASNKVMRALLTAGGLGAALRGVSGLRHLFESSPNPPPTSTVEMPVVYPQKREEEKLASLSDGDSDTATSPYGLFDGDSDTATSPYGLSGYIPAILLGTPLAAYGGWKGVDAILDKQRRKRTEDELDEAKQDYQQTLLSSYKQAEDEGDLEADLDQAFDGYQKQAGLVSALQKHFPNAEGILKGLAISYAVPTSVAGYMAVNNMMQDNSKRALLQKAMQERARRRAQQQPAELYAVPSPQQDKDN